MPYAEASSGFLAVSVLRHPRRPWCSGKRNSPASSTLLSTKHWRYRRRRLRGVDRALPGGAEECFRARPRLGVNAGTNDRDTRWPGLHTQVPRHTACTCLRASRSGWSRAASGSVAPSTGSPVARRTAVPRAVAWGRRGGILA